MVQENIGMPMVYSIRGSNLYHFGSMINIFALPMSELNNNGNRYDQEHCLVLSFLVFIGLVNGLYDIVIRLMTSPDIDIAFLWREDDESWLVGCNYHRPDIVPGH
jgi:hypothetical protein